MVGGYARTIHKEYDGLHHSTAPESEWYRGASRYNHLRGASNSQWTSSQPIRSRGHADYNRKSKHNERIHSSFYANKDQRICQSHQIHQKFYEAVTKACNNAMSPARPTWRQLYHATNLDLILAISSEIDKHQEFTTFNDWPNADVLAEINHTLAHKCSPTSSDLTKDEEILDSASSITSPTFLTCSSRITAPSSILTSPMTVYAEQSSPSSSTQVSEAYNGGVIRCECGEEFEGSSNASNFQRHRRYSLAHVPSASFGCPDCGARFTRSDNLGKHIRKTHFLPVNSGLQS